jgi:hypothetical protein
LFLGRDSVLPAKQLAAMRIGVEDYEYLYMLKQTLQNAEKNNLNSDLIQKGHSLLDSAVDRVLNVPGIAGDYGNLEWSHPKDRSLADQVRIEIGQWLVKAARALVAANR